MTQIAIVSAGAFGTALASVLAQNGHDIRLHVRERDVYHTIKHTRVNSYYLPDVQLDLNRILPTRDLGKAVPGADIVFFAVPTQYAEETVQRLSQCVDSKTILVLTTKGRATKVESLVDVTSRILPSVTVCGLYGITFADMIARGTGMSSMCIASTDPSAGEQVAELFRSRSGRHFRIYLSHDIKGVQYCTAMKNVYAIAMGLVDGYLEARRTGELQSRRTVQNECLIEFLEFGLVYGAELHTLIGPAGVGDILASSTPPSPSRNYTFGKWFALTQLGQASGKAADVHEGYETCAAMMEIACDLNVQAPILCATHNTLFGDASVDSSISELFNGLGTVVTCGAAGSFDDLLRKATTVAEHTKSAPKVKKVKKPSVFVSYHFTPEGELLLATLRNICSLFDVEVVTGQSIGFHLPQEGISQVVKSKLQQSNFYVAVFTKESEEARWLADERAMAIALGKPMLVLLEEGASPSQLGELQSEHPYHPFSKKTFASLVEEHLRTSFERAKAAVQQSRGGRGEKQRRAPHAKSLGGKSGERSFP